MHQCLVCSNSTARTKHTRPDVIYHTFPSNLINRNKWLKVYGIESCNNWNRICSDHFLPEHYRPGAKRFLKKNILPLPYTNREEDGFPLSYTAESTDVETGNNNLLARDQNLISYTAESTDVETGNNNLLARDQNLISYTAESTDVETGNNNLLARDQNLISYTAGSTDVETGNNNLLARDQNLISYTAESTDVETRNNNLLARDQNLIREEQSTVVNNFGSPRRSYRKIKLTTTNQDMSYENMPNLQTERFERQIPTLVANDNIQPVIESVEVPVITTTKDYTLGSGSLCSVKNCFNRYSADLSFFGYPRDFTLRKEWIEKCGLTVDPTQKMKSGVRVCRVHFEDHCFINTERRNRLRPNAVPSLFLDGDNIEGRNKPSSAKRSLNSCKKRTPAKSGFIRTNKNRPSCSSTNYVANINSQKTPLLVYIDSTIRHTKNLEAYCVVPGCITNSIEEIEDISLFSPPIECVNSWGSALNLRLTTNSMICERHFRQKDILYPTLLVDGIGKRLKSLKPTALPILTNDVQSAANSMPLDAVQSATNDMPLDAVQSATNSMPLDAMQSATNSMPLDAMQSATNSMPLDAMQSATNGMPLDAVQSATNGMLLDAEQSASNARPLETNDAPVLRTYLGNLKRSKVDGQLSAKKSKIDVLDKSEAGTNKMYFSKNEKNEFTTITNSTHSYNSTCDSDKKSESSTVIPVDLSIVKIEPNDDDNNSQTNLETKTKQIIKPEPVEDNNLLPSSSIDDSLSISLKKLKKISNSSLSITLEPIDSTKISEPSVNLLSKTSAKNSMSITLQPKLHNNLSSTTNNNSPSVSLIPSLPSTSSSSVHNISQQTPLQYKLEATSTSKMPHKLSSNTVVRPEIIDRQIIFLKPIPPTNTSNSSELPKIKTPVISKCISLARKSHTHSNSNCSKNDSEFIMVDDDIDTEAFIQEDNGFIYEISKSVSLPSLFWKIEYISGRNSTHFYQQDNFGKFIKKISFNNSLLPIIHIHGKKYEYNKLIKTKNELHNLIEKIDGIYKCVGIEKFVNKNCTGFCEGNSEGVHRCFSCQKKYQEMHKTKKSQTTIKEGLGEMISQNSKQSSELKENNEDDGRSHTPEELSFQYALVNCMMPRH